MLWQNTMLLDTTSNRLPGAKHAVFSTNHLADIAIDIGLCWGYAVCRGP